MGQYNSVFDNIPQPPPPPPTEGCEIVSTVQTHNGVHVKMRAARRSTLDDRETTQMAIAAATQAIGTCNYDVTNSGAIDLVDAFGEAVDDAMLASNSKPPGSYWTRTFKFLSRI